MALRKPLFFGDPGPEEMDPADSVQLGGATLTGDIQMSGNEVLGLPATPSAGGAAASKTYVDNVAANLKPKEQVKAMADTDQTLSGLPTNIDNVTTWAANDRVLLTGQTTASENGIWLVQTGAWTRPADFDTGDPASGAFVFVDQGDDYKDTGWVCTTDSGSDVIDTDDLAFAQFSQIPLSAGDGIDISSGTISVDLAASNPALGFDGVGGLQVELDGGTLQKGASGLSVVGLPSLFEINGTAVGATVTAANLDTLTDGSTGVTLHSHPASPADRLEDELTAQEALNQGDPIEVGTVNDQYRQCRASTAARVDCMAVVEESGGISASGTGTCVRRGVAVGVLSGATAGDRYYVADAGGLIQGMGGISAGNHVVFVGCAVNATDLEVNPQYMYKKAA
jgi:hypothetical protein